MNDIEFKLTLIDINEDCSNQKIKEASYIINEACSKLEDMKFQVSYQVKVNGSKIIIEEP